MDDQERKRQWRTDHRNRLYASGKKQVAVFLDEGVYDAILDAKETHGFRNNSDVVNAVFRRGAVDLLRAGA